MHPLADGVDVLEVALRDNVVNDGHTRRTAHILCGERPPGQEPDSHSLKVLRAHDGVLRAGGFLSRNLPHDFRVKRVVLLLPGERQNRNRGGGLNARQHFQLFQRLREVAFLLCGTIVTSLWEHGAKDQHALPVQAGIHAAQRGEALQQQPGPNQQHQGKRDLRGDQR